MAEIPGVTIDFTDYSAPSIPRTVHIPAPLVEASTQDLIDTLASKQAELDNLVYDALMSASGKDDLGGGVFVGLTQRLLNARISFDARKDSTTVGAVTTADANGIVLTDINAQFQTDGIEPGAWGVNFSDGSICSVIRVLSETQLLTDGLGGGTDNQWEIGDVYKLYNITQVEVDGGNVVAVDDVGDPINPILPTAGTQAVRTSSSSATLQEQTDIQFSSYANKVTVDPVNGVAGTEFPTGTERQPVNNLADALTIAASVGLRRIGVIGSITLTGGLDFTGLRFEGDSPNATSIVVDASAQVNNTEFAYVYLSGVFDGLVSIERCVLGNVVMISGFVERTGLEGTVTLDGAGDLHLVNCYSAGVSVVDFAGAGSSLIATGWQGPISLINKSGPEPVSIDMDSGEVSLSPTISAGTITVRGVGPQPLNNMTGTALLDTDGLTNPKNVTESVWKGAQDDYVQGGTMGQTLVELFRLAGLDPTRPLVVSKTARSAGPEIDQDIDDDGTTTTVTRK